MVNNNIKIGRNLFHVFSFQGRSNLGTHRPPLCFHHQEAFESNKYSDSINTALGHGVKNAYVGASVTAFSTYLNLGTAVLILWYGGQLVCDSEGKIMSIGCQVAPLKTSAVVFSVSVLDFCKYVHALP